MKKTLVFSTYEGMLPYCKKDIFIQEGKSFRLFNQALDLLLNEEEVRNSFLKIISPDFIKLQDMFGLDKAERLLNKLFQLENIGIPCLFYFNTMEYLKEESNMFEIYFDDMYGDTRWIATAQTKDEIISSITEWVHYINPKYKIYYVRHHIDEDGVWHIDIGSHSEFFRAVPVSRPDKDELTMNN